MAEAFKKDVLRRIEDFIALAKEGKDVQVSIELKKQLVSQKVHPGDTEDMKCEVDMYLLLCDYAFTVGEEVNHVSKLYMYGCLEESMVDANVNRNIANERLKMDYKRLTEANITFEEKYF